MITKVIFGPFSYLTIIHREKFIIDWILPSSISLVLVLAAFLLNSHSYIDYLGESGVIDRVLSFIQILPGFYIAALSAIATFNRTDIDRIMPAPAPKMDISIDGKRVNIELTRRRFLCSMFAYLTAGTVIVILMSIVAIESKEFLLASLNSSIVVPTMYLGLFLYLFLLSQLICTTFWGLNYLGDKLHQPDR
jgi:hypothetical protein